MRPYYSDGLVTLYHGDCRDVLPTLADDSFAVVMTDPPYGVKKAAWDETFPTWWMADAARLAPTLALMPGVANLLACPPAIARLQYRWTLCGYITNGMTKSAFGFGNWIPCLIYTADGVRIEQRQPDARTFAVRGRKPRHPSPKNYEAVAWMLSLLPNGPVLDMFAGSGTTLLAAKNLGRPSTGIESNERYCEETANRVRQCVLDLGAA